MIIKKDNAVFITNLTSKRLGVITNLLDEYNIASSDIIKSLAKGLIADADTNHSLIVFTKGNHKINRIVLDGKYMDDKCFANGHKKLRREANVMLSNFIDGLNSFDIDIIAKWVSQLPNQQIMFNTLVTHYNKTPQLCLELFDYIYKASNYDKFGDYSSKTHFYKKDLSLSVCARMYDGDCKYIFPLTEIQVCEETQKEFLIIRGNFDEYQLAVFYRGSWICSEYFEDSYSMCESCESMHHQEDMRYLDEYDDGVDNDGYYCSDCADNALDNRYNDAIRYYSYKPTAKFFHMDGNKMTYSHKPKSILNFGIELEIEARHSDVYLNENAHYVNGLFDGLFYCKDDGSIGGNGGFEIVSHPITFKALQQLDLKNTICKMNNEFKAFHTQNCGMHIHLSRSAFNPMQHYKFVLMMNSYKTLVHLVSQRRRISEYGNWCRFSDDIANDVKSKAVENIKRQKNHIKYNKENNPNRRTKLNHISEIYAGQRYQVVNDQNPATLEIRSFKANLKYEGIMKNIEFAHSMFYFCKNASLQDLSNIESYLDFVKADYKTYKNLNIFFNENKKTLEHIIKNPNEDLK